MLDEDKQLELEKADKSKNSEPDDTEINAYMEESVYNLKNEKRVEVLQATYRDLLTECEVLAVQREQASRMKDEERGNRITTAGRANYKLRHDTVTALRLLGEKIDDHWVPDRTK